MMKAVVTMQDGKTLVVLGLSFANLDKLRAESADGFMLIKGADLGIANDIMIFSAETEQKMMELADRIWPGTKKIDERFKS